MRETYDPAEVESVQQAHWRAKDIYRAVEHALDANGNEKPKFYVCPMLPYPSGKLHMGHVRNYTLNDVLYRYLRMRGMNVMTPMGWDSFGLPAENAAIAKKVAPAKWTYANIADMKAQMEPLGLAFDWSRDLQARLLPLESVDVPENARKRRCLPQDPDSELGPGRPHRFGQRTGD